jgi:hypothetical protein
MVALAKHAEFVLGIPPQLSWNRFESPSLPNSEKLDWFIYRVESLIILDGLELMK